MFQNLTQAQAIEILRQIRPHLAALIPLLGNGFPILEQEGEINELSRNDLIHELENKYGITIGASQGFLVFLTNEQLLQIYGGIQGLSESFMAEIERCGYSNLVTGELTPETVFRQVFRIEQHPIEIRYYPCEDGDCDENSPPQKGLFRYASMDTSFQDGTDKAYLTIPQFQLDNLADNTVLDINWLIAHELMHAFHNYYGLCEDCDPPIYIDLETGEPTDEDMPILIRDFLEQTGGTYQDGVYIPGIDTTLEKAERDVIEEQMEIFLPNEFGETDHPEPKEGVADVMALYFTQPREDLPKYMDNTRLNFVSKDNICKWLYEMLTHGG